MAENHALAKRSQQKVMRQTSQEKKNQSRWAVGGVPGKMVGDADHGTERRKFTGNDVDGFLIDAVETEDIGCATDKSELSMVHGKNYL